MKSSSIFQYLCLWILICLLSPATGLYGAYEESDKEDTSEEETTPRGTVPKPPTGYTLPILLESEVAEGDTRHMPTKEWLNPVSASSTLVLDLDGTIWIADDDNDKPLTRGRSSFEADAFCTHAVEFEFIDVPFYKELFSLCQTHKIKVLFLSHGWHRRNLIQYYFEKIVETPDVNWSVLGKNNLKVFSTVIGKDCDQFCFFREGEAIPLKWKVMHLIHELTPAPMLLIDNRDSVHKRLLAAQITGKCDRNIKSLWNQLGDAFIEQKRCKTNNLLDFLKASKVPDEEISFLLSLCPFVYGK